MTIKSNTIDRLMVVLTAAGLIVIALCIHVVSLAEFESSARGSMIWLAMFMLAIYVSAVFWRLAGAVAKFFISRFSSDRFELTPPDAETRLSLARAATLAMEGQLRWNAANVRLMLRLLAGATMLASALGLLSLIGMLFSGGAIGVIGGQVVWIFWTFELYRFAAEFICMLPLAIGMTGVFHAGMNLRCGMGRDVYAAIFRDWLIAIAAGAFVFSLAWFVGMNMIGLAVVAAIFLFAGAATVFVRRTITTRGGKFERQPIDQKVRGRWAVASIFAVATLVAMLQLRLIADATHIGMAGRLIWLSAILLLLAFFLANVDHKSSPPGASADAGARIGLASAIMSQIALSWIAAGDQTGGWICLAMAAITAGPMTYLAAVVISRQRRAFAAVGGQAGQYIGYATLGSSVAVLVYLCCGQFAMLGLSLGVVVMVAFAATFGQWLSSRSPRLRWIWGVSGLATILFGVFGMLGVGASMDDSVGSLRPGLWLTSCTDSGDRRLPGRGYLPYNRFAASDDVSRVLDYVVASNSGRWLIVGGDDRMLTSMIDTSVISQITSCDPASSGSSSRTASGISGDFFASMAFEHEQFTGVLFASLPADHSQARRLFNVEILKKCFAQKRLLAVRTRVANDRLSDLVAIARTFESVVGDGWAVLAFDEFGCDVLLVGPERFAGRVPPIISGQMYLVPLKDLWRDWGDIQPWSILNPPSIWNVGKIDIYDLKIWLARRK